MRTYHRWRALRSLATRPREIATFWNIPHVAEVCGLWGQSAAGDDEPFVPGTTRYDAVTERLSEA